MNKRKIILQKTTSIKEKIYISDNLLKNPFCLAVFNDSQIFTSKNKSLDIVQAEDVCTEYEFYLRSVAFNLAHTLTWCRQLDLAIELLTNFDYSKRSSTSKADHYIYNLENYWIRINSIYDRVLQLTNSVFHICLSDKDVTEKNIINNSRVKHSKKIHSTINRIKRHLVKYTPIRNTLLHKHSIVEKDIRTIELFYLPNIELNLKDEKLCNFKAYRASFLREHTIKTKNEFREANKSIVTFLDLLFNLFLFEYELQKKRLKIA